MVTTTEKTSDVMAKKDKDKQVGEGERAGQERQRDRPRRCWPTTRT